MASNKDVVFVKKYDSANTWKNDLKTAFNNLYLGVLLFGGILVFFACNLFMEVGIILSNLNA